MYLPRIQSASEKIALGALLGAFSLGALVLASQGCATSSSVIACKLDALKVLPEDPRMVTPYDAVDLVNRLKECRKAAQDAGAP